MPEAEVVPTAEVVVPADPVPVAVKDPAPSRARSSFRVVGADAGPVKAPVRPATIIAKPVAESAPVAEVVTPVAAAVPAEAVAVADPAPIAPPVERSSRSKEIIRQLDEQARLTRERKKFEAEKRAQADEIAKARDEAGRIKAEGERKLSEATNLGALFESAKSNPAKMLELVEKHGVTYQDIMAAGVALTPEQKASVQAAEKAKELEIRLTNTEKLALDRLAAVEKELAETKATAESERAANVVRNFEANAVAEVKALAKEFPWTNTVGMTRDVLNEIRNHAAEHGEVISTREAVAKVEARAKASADGFLDAAKENPAVRDYILKKFGGVAAPAAKPAAAAPVKPSPTEPAPVATKPAVAPSERNAAGKPVKIDNTFNTAGPGVPWLGVTGDHPKSRRDLDNHFAQWEAKRVGGKK